jgi:hypothetical protein
MKRIIDLGTVTDNDDSGTAEQGGECRGVAALHNIMVSSSMIWLSSEIQKLAPKNLSLDFGFVVRVFG